MKTILYTIPHLLRSGPTLVLYGLIKNLDRARFTPVILTLADEQTNSLKPDFEKLDIQVYCLHKRGINTFLSGAIQFRRLLTQIKPDIIHANGFRDIVLTALFAPKKYKKCATVHCDWHVDYCLKYGGVTGRMSSYLQSRALQQIHCRIACSQMLADLLNKKYPHLNFNYVNNGVDTEKFHPVSDKMALRRQLKLPTDKEIIIWAGSFIPRKDPLTMAKAICQIPENQYYFVFCGARGPLLEICKEMLKTRRDVLFTGYITNIEQYYQAADRYVSTSLSEGLPLAVLEAQFCGLKPLLSDIPQHRYIFPQEHDLFPVQRPHTLVDKILVDSKTTAISEQLNNFSAQKMSQKYQELYEKYR